MRSDVIEVTTGGSDAVVDLTGRCEEFLDQVDAEEGLLHVFVQHATAGLALMELGSSSDDDLLNVLGDVLPVDYRWRHAHGSRGHGRSHVMPALLPPYASVPVVGGRLALGTWQSVALVDLNVDNRSRRVCLSYLRG
ncbi:MAG: secondary thiamine-phosphate synthase enzyme YjbQ [Streptosporangiales bacterium]